jgi:hypothetical protein
VLNAVRRDDDPAFDPENIQESHQTITSTMTYQRAEPLQCKGSLGTPGGTRIPNLLIRRQALFGQSVVLALDDASTLTLPQRSVAMESFAARSWCFRCNELLLFRTVATTPGCAW